MTRAAKDENLATFTIFASGTCMGSFHAADSDGAVDAYVRDAGYASVDAAAAVLGMSTELFRAELRVVKASS